ncbi:MAG: hypothetical protein LBH64_03575 [Coriobacteriales bacterium]|nr:hypothetical protein [Coriobacteriales bacterium]
MLDALAFAQRALAQQEGVSTRLDELAAQLESLAIMADDLAASFRAYREDVEFDPQALEEALARLAALEGLRKRYGPRMEDVFAAWEQAALRLSLTEDRDERLKAAEGALDEAEEALREAAHELAFVRGRAAEALAEELNLSMRGLAMEGASISFSCQELARSAWTRGASVRYELLYQPSATSSPRPLAKIASGGEHSRVMLALKPLLGPAGGAKVLIFDEVDAGIGGAAAIAVADRLRALAESQQVIVVTHLAQIAAIADCQFVVEKSWEDGGSAFTVIREVAGEERVAEIARMLAGATDETALEHARELLASREGARRS